MDIQALIWARTGLIDSILASIDLTIAFIAAIDLKFSCYAPKVAVIYSILSAKNVQSRVFLAAENDAARIDALFGLYIALLESYASNLAIFAYRFFDQPRVLKILI